MKRPPSYKAGAASICITPDEPLWLAGYAVRSAPARGKLSDLFARALVIEDESRSCLVLVSVDIIAITPIIADSVIQAAGTRHGLSRNQLLLVPTHTHYGPEFRPDKQIFFSIPDEYAAKLPAVANTLATAITNVIDQAIEQLEPVRLFVRTASVGFALNRRRHGVKEGKPSNEDIVDHEVPVLDCVDAAGNRKAIVFGYACHNTTIPPGDLRYCGDWAGFAAEQLQQTNPGATALFIPGAGADQDPEPHGSVEFAQQHGREIASAVQASLDAPAIEVTGPIRSELEDVLLMLKPVTHDSLQRMLDSNDPPQQVKAKYLLDQLDRGEKLIDSYTAPIQVIRFGNVLLIVALSGEPVVDFSHKFKRELEHGAGGKEQGVGILTPCSPLPAPRFPFVWVAGYCNDMFGYLPTQRVQSEGGYEGGRANLWSWIPAPFTDDVEERVTNAVLRLVNRIGN